MIKKLTQADPWLEPYTDALKARSKHLLTHSKRILAGKSVSEFALGYLHYGLHRHESAWVMREWAPNATSVALIGDHNDWRPGPEDEFSRDGDDWTLELPLDSLRHGMKYKLLVRWNGGEGERIPAYARYVVQDDATKLFAAQVWSPEEEFTWSDHDRAAPSGPPLIYEAHIGMSSENEEVASYAYFEKYVLPRIVQAGYNTLQLMAIAEHPYYGSFGYHVSSYFAPSSRFGTPDELKSLINAAHLAGLRVIMDIVHSHAVKNEAEGLGLFDGTPDQYFHGGDRGMHSQWDSRVFDYGKPEVAHFLLSNVRYWLDEFHFDGYRFDGVTSMLYKSHGLEKSFTSYDDYFSDDTDLDALTYLVMANAVVRDVAPSAITIAEDMSALPGIAMPVADGGMGFDYRLSMGVPDLWIKTLKHKTDEEWDLAHLLYELKAHRPEERTISYAESHDQALVGDKTLFFRLADKAMYDHMHIKDESLEVSRAVALHKMIRLITATTHAGGYLNFMGNEFGHPEWIDFPREGNNWSYRYARRQWSLVDNADLKFHQLAQFDRAMVRVVAEMRDAAVSHEYIHQQDGVVSYARGEYICVYNFSPAASHVEYELPVPASFSYQILLDSDATQYGGFGRVDSDIVYEAAEGLLPIYLPARTALVFRQVK